MKPATKTAKAAATTPYDPGAREDTRARSLVTPEGVDLKLRLGDAGERAAALFIDLAIMLGVLIAFFLLAVLTMVGTKGKGWELVGTLGLLVFFILRNLYFVLFELTPGAATPGKRAMGVRVAARNGGRLTADAIFARNAMREIELYLPLSFLASSGDKVSAWINLAGLVWCLVFVLFPLFNRDRLRVGDMVAGTWVVKAPTRKLAPDLVETSRPPVGRSSSPRPSWTPTASRSCTCWRTCCAATRARPSPWSRLASA